AHVGQHVSVGQHHALGIVSGSRGVLNKGDVGDLHVTGPPAVTSFLADVLKFCHRGDTLQVRQAQADQLREGPDAVKANEETDIGVAQNLDLAPDVFFDLV